MKKLNGIIGMGICMLLAMGWSNLHGQNGNYGVAYIVVANPGQGDELYDAIKEHAEWRREQGDPWWWDVYQVVVGEGLGQYEIVSFGHSLADIDAYEEFLDKGSVEWNRDVAPYIAKISNVFFRGDMALSRWPEGTPNDYVMLVDYEVKPSGAAMWRFRESIRQVHETIVEHDYPNVYGWNTVFAGSERNVMTFVKPGSSYADLEGPEEGLWEFLVRVHGEDKANEIVAGYNENVTGEKARILKKLPELGVAPPSE